MVFFFRILLWLGGEREERERESEINYFKLIFVCDIFIF